MTWRVEMLAVMMIISKVRENLVLESVVYQGPNRWSALLV